MSTLAQLMGDALVEEMFQVTVAVPPVNHVTLVLGLVTENGVVVFTTVTFTVSSM